MATGYIYWQDLPVADHGRRLEKAGNDRSGLSSLVTRDFFDPTPEEQSAVLVSAGTLREAKKLIDSCEHCNPEGSEIPFDNILDRVTGSEPSVTDYILEMPAKCPNYRREATPDLSLRRNVALVLNVLAGGWFDRSQLRMNIRECLRALVAALGDSDSNVRAWAAQAIGVLARTQRKPFQPWLVCLEMVMKDRATARALR